MAERSNRSNRPNSRSKQQEVQEKANDEICAECNKVVKESDKALQCQICYRWFHTQCGKTKISAEVYKALTEETDCGLHYYCKVCNLAAVGIIESLTRLDIKVRGLEQKINKMSSELEEKVNKDEIQALVDKSIEIKLEHPSGKAIIQKTIEISLNKNDDKLRKIIREINECEKRKKKTTW